MVQDFLHQQYYGFYRDSGVIFLKIGHPRGLNPGVQKNGNCEKVPHPDNNLKRCPEELQ